MPQIDRVPNMRKAPGRCGICNTTPNDVSGQPLPAIDTNVDVDWGNNFYICDECVRVIGELMGWVSPEDHEKLRSDFGQLRDDHRRLRKKFKERGEDLSALAKGEKIRRRERKKVAA